VLTERAAGGDVQPLVDHVRAYITNPRALEAFLHDLSVTFTYDEGLRTSLNRVWRPIMEEALGQIAGGVDLLGDGDWPRPQALAALLPIPRLRLGDPDPDATLNRAWESWPPVDEIADLVTRWIAIAEGVPEAVDAAGQLARCAPSEWQASTGLRWVEDLADGFYGAVSPISWLLIDWLEKVHSSGYLNGDGAARWRRIVDGLAAAGDSGAARLQRLEE